MTTHKKAYVAVLLYVLIIGFSFLFVKIALTEASPLDTLAHRFTIAFIIATIPILLGKVHVKMTMRDIISIIPLALLYPTLFFMFQVFGLVCTSSSEAGIINATIPIFTLVLATFYLNERSNNLQKVFIFLSVVGVILIFIMNGMNVENYRPKGAVLILLSALSASFYNVLARKLTKHFNLFTLTYVMTVLGFIAFNGIAITNHIIEKSLASFLLPFFSIEFIVSIVYLGVLSSLCTSFLSNYALSKIDASKVSVFSNLATLITVIVGVIFLNETMQFYHIIGAVVILIGVIGTNYFGTKKEKTVKGMRRSQH